MNLLIQSNVADAERAIAVAQHEGKQLFTHRTCNLKAIIQQPALYNTIHQDYFCLFCRVIVHSCNVLETYEHK